MTTMWARHDDGSETEITEGVKAAYDNVVSSMDWGSGFLTAEDALPIAELARVCDFPEWKEAARYVAALAASPEQAVFLMKRIVPGSTLTEHDHVEGKYAYRQPRKCVWPGCPAVLVHSLQNNWETPS